MPYLTTQEIDNLVKWGVHLTGLGQALVDFHTTGADHQLKVFAATLAAEVQRQNEQRDDAEALKPLIELAKGTAFIGIRRIRSTVKDPCSGYHYSRQPRASYRIGGAALCGRCARSKVVSEANASLKAKVEALTGEQIDNMTWHMARANDYTIDPSILKSAPLEDK